MVEINLSNKVSIVTGSANGMGKAIATKLAEAGSAVMISDLNYNAALAVAEDLRSRGFSADAVHTDVTNKEDALKMADATIKSFGKIDILVNNAGIARFTPFIKIEENEWDQMFNVNVKGVYNCTQAVLPHMIKARTGQIVSLASQAGKEAYPLLNHYSATKFAVVGMTQGLAKEMAEYNINVNAVCPGIVKTDMWGPAILDQISGHTGVPQDQVWQGFIDEIPFKRPQEPVDIANAVAFLCSDLAKNITGQAINVSGGSQMH